MSVNSFKNSKARTFRIFMGIVGLFLLFISVFGFYKTISTVTDENYFTDPLSKICVNKPFAVKFQKGKKIRIDTIVPGDLLLNVGGKKIEKIEELSEIVHTPMPADSLYITVLSISKNKIIKYKMASLDFKQSNFTYMNSAVIITQIIPGGASDRAGLVEGDIITKINGKSFNNSYYADRILKSLNADKEFEYEILHKGQFKTVKIILAKFGIGFEVLANFITGLLFLLVGLMFALLRPNLIAAKLVGVGLILISVEIVTADYLYVSFPNLRLLTATLSSILVLFGITTLIHSSFYFPNEKPGIIAKKWTHYSLYILTSILSAMLFCFNIFNFEFKSNLVLPFSIFIPFTFALHSVIVQFKYNKDGWRKHDVKMSAVLIFAFTLNILSLMFKPIKEQIIPDINIDVYVIIVLALIPLAYLYTVARYRLLDMDFKIRKNNQYLLTILIQRSIYIFLFALIIWNLAHLDYYLPNLRFTGSSIEVLNWPLRDELKNMYMRFILGFISLGVGCAFWKLDGFGKKFLDRKFFRSKFDYKRADSEIRLAMEHNYTITTLIVEIAEKLTQIAFLKKAGFILFKNETSLLCQGYYANENENFNNEINEVCKPLISASMLIFGSFRTEYLQEPLKSIFLNNNFVYLIPIKAKGQLQGLLVIGEKLSETPFNNLDLEFLQTIASQSAVAIENAMLYENIAKQERMRHELELARKIQLSSLPQNKPDIPGLDIAGVSNPAFEVGGDFYDYLSNDGCHITVLVGDVSGKGASAALYMSRAQGILRSLYEYNPNPRELFLRLNENLYRYIERNAFISVIGARFCSGDKNLKVARAGHLPMLVYRADTSTMEEYSPRGIALGIAKSDWIAPKIEEITVDYKIGDVFVFMTDGALEARRGNEEFGYDRIKDVIKENALLSSSEIVNAILIAVKEFSTEESQGDDLTVVVVKAED